MEPKDVQHQFQAANNKMQVAMIQSVDEHLDANPLPKTPVQETLLSDVWKVGRPVLILIEGALFFKASWHDAIKALIAKLDAETAAPTPENNMPL